MRLGTALHQSCLGAKDTTQNLLEKLVSLLKKRYCHKNTVDAQDVLQNSKALAKCELNQTVKVACSSV